MKPKQIIDTIVEDLNNHFVRKTKAIADMVRPTMEKIYKDREGHMDTRIAFPITDGRLRYAVPVELQKCKDSDCLEIYREFAKVALFTTIDDAWREHLREMDDLRQSVQNATYEQKDPLLIYKLESFQLFSKMLEDINRDVLALINKSGIAVREADSNSVQEAREQKAKIETMLVAVDKAYGIMIDNLKAEQFEPLGLRLATDSEIEINDLRNNIREQEIHKIEIDGSNYQSSVYYLDTVSEIERMGDFIINISQALDK